MSNQIGGIPCSDPLNVTLSSGTTGLATTAKQDIGNASLATIAAKDFATQTTLAAILAALAGIVTTDNGPAWATAIGVAGVPFTSADQHSAVASVTDAPTSGKKLVITDLILSSDTAMRLDFNVESSATVIASFYIGANQTAQLTLRGKWKLATANKKLQVQSSVAGNISILPLYYSET